MPAKAHKGHHMSRVVYRGEKSEMVPPERLELPTY